MHYEDFEVRIRSDRRGGFVAEARSFYGEAAEPFVPPFPLASIAEMLTAWDLRSGGMRHVECVDESPGSAPESPEDIGAALYAAAFPGTIDLRLRECLAALDPQRDVQGLRLLFAFDPDDREVAPLAALPWELVFDRGRRSFLSRLPHVQVVRYLSIPGSPPAALDGRLRILVVHAAPAGWAPLDLTGEWRRIQAALGASASLDVEHCACSTLEGLHRRLRGEEWHILHFMGHGDFDASGQGSLAFEGLDRGEHRVSGTLLGASLQSPHLRLVVLNACESGALARRDGQDPYGSMASSLLLAGVPSVLAMQFSIQDDAAIAFSAELYARLAASEPLEAAVAEARLALLRLDETSAAWATPVLFTRVAGPAIPAPAPVAVWRKTPLRLGIRSFSDLGPGLLWDHEIDNACDDVLDLRCFFEGRQNRYIKDPVDWQTRIVAKLRKFLAAAVAARRPLRITFAAHLSIAFAAGHLLESKSSLDVTIRQPHRDKGLEDWRVFAGASRGAASFLAEPAEPAESDMPRDPGSRDVAVALGASGPIQEDVANYLDRARISVRRILPAHLGPAGVRNGRHALRLAQDLAWTIRGRRGDERDGTLHLFIAAPNGLTFFLGQLSRAFGRVQLYEHDFDAPDTSRYSPSLRFPLD
jgi:hypothetical protein